MFTSENQVKDYIENLSKNITATISSEKLKWLCSKSENNFNSTALSKWTFYIKEDNYVGNAKDFVSENALKKLEDKLTALPDTKPLLEYVPGHDFGKDVVLLTVEASLNNESNPWDPNTIFVRYELQISQNETEKFDILKREKTYAPYFSKDGLLATVRDENTFEETVSDIAAGLKNILENLNRDFWENLSAFPRFADTDTYIERYPKALKKIG